MRAGSFATPQRMAAWIGAAVLAVAIGCRREPATEAMPEAETVGTVTAPAEPPAEPSATFEPPPTLAALDRQVTWVDRPVRDPYALERERDAGEPAAGTVAEAIALPNDGPDANARILAALTRPKPAGVPAAVERAVRRIAADVGSLNPVRAETQADFDLLGLAGLDLFGFDRGLAPFANADTVTSWSTSADGLVDKVVIRSDLVWSDGTPVSARDVAFSWRLLVDPRVPARAFRDAAARLRGVHAYDERTVVFFHAEPLATNAWNIDFPLLPSHVYAPTWEADPTLVESSAHAARESRPVTGGPYEVAERTPGREIVLRRRPGWSVVRGRKVREPAPIPEIRLTVVEDPAAALAALGSGAVDEAALEPDEWVAAAADTAFAERAARVVTPEWRSVQIAWSLDTPLFADKRVRRAMGYAIDRSRLLDTVCHGLAAPPTGIFAPGSWAASRGRLEPARQDLATAEALLDEAGWVDRDGDGVRDRDVAGRLVPFAFTLHCDRQPFRMEVCRVVRECLARVGVNCTVRSVEPRELHDLLRARRFEAALVSWGTGIDPDSAESLWCGGGAQNYSGYANAEVDRLFAEGRRERDRERRAETYARIQAIVSEDQPSTWLFWRQDYQGFSRALAADLFDLRGALHWSPGLSTAWKPTLE
jgi:peptide/nickel transport system substrate-binding protein